MLVFGLAGPVLSGDDNQQESWFFHGDPAGARQLTVAFPSPAMPPFTEIITLHRGGTLTESNTPLHSNGSNEFFPFNGSPGHGIWKRRWAGNVDFKFRKFVFDGFTNQHIAYLEVEGSFRPQNGEWIDQGATTVLLDLKGNVIQDFGTSSSSGFKLEL